MVGFIGLVLGCSIITAVMGLAGAIAWTSNDHQAGVMFWLVGALVDIGMIGAALAIAWA